MSSVCPKCGRSVSFSENRSLCLDCFFEINSDSDSLEIKKFSLKRCSFCDQYFYRGSWHPGFSKKSLERIIKNNIKKEEGIIIFDLYLTKFKDKKGKVSTEISYSVGFKKAGIKNRKSYTKKIIFNFEKINCEICKKKFNYYEAIIQFRDFEKSELVGELDNINKKFITNLKESKSGMDIYISDKGYAKKTVKKFSRKKEEFIIKKSEKESGKDKHGKRRSRLTISVRKKKDKKL